MRFERLFFRAFWALILLAAAPAFAEEPAAQTPPEPHWAIIHAGTLIARADRAPLRNQSIIVKDDRIEKVSAGFLTPAEAGLSDAAEVIELRDAYVMPGLIDAHVHLGEAGKFSEKRTDETGVDVYRMLDVIENARKTLDAGYTTVRDVGSEGWNVIAFRDGVKKGVFAGPRVFSAGHIIHVGTFDQDDSGACYDAASCKKAVRRQVEMGADWIKIYATCSGSKPCGTEFAPGQILPDELDAIMEAAKTADIPVAAHAHGTAGINDALRAGVRSIEHGSYNDKESRALFKKNSAFYVPTLAVHDRILAEIGTASPEMKPVMQAFLDTHEARVAAAHEAGVKIAAGSDAGITPHGKNARELYWYVQAGMSEAEALQSATLVDAALLGKEKDLGSIEAGKFADIIALAKNPLDDIEALADVGFVMAGGKVVKSALPAESH